jgi:TadE-like protein
MGVDRLYRIVDITDQTVRCRHGIAASAARGMSPMCGKEGGRATSRRHGRGQSIVEMALITPIFILICVGILDFGRAFYSYERIQNAAREGAAWLASTRSTAGVPNRVASEGVTCANGSVQVDTGARAPRIVNGEAIVDVTCAFDLITPFMGAALGQAEPCRVWMGIRLCQPNQRIILKGHAQMPVIG